MNSLPVGSVQSWLAVATATVSPVIALMVGFAGTDWLIRRQLGEMCDHAPLEGGGARGRLTPGAWPPPRVAAWNSHLNCRGTAPTAQRWNRS
jgi:hypothetical protein